MFVNRYEKPPKEASIYQSDSGLSPYFEALLMRKKDHKQHRTVQHGESLADMSFNQHLSHSQDDHNPMKVKSTRLLTNRSLLSAALKE